MSRLTGELLAEALRLDAVLSEGDFEYIFTEIANDAGRHGDFLKSFAETFLRADIENRQVIKPPALYLIAKYDLIKHLPKVSTYSISPDGKSITCHVCGQTSHNLNDVREKYCGKCHVFHEDK